MSKFEELKWLLINWLTKDYEYQGDPDDFITDVEELASIILKKLGVEE